MFYPGTGAFLALGKAEGVGAAQPQKKRLRGNLVQECLREGSRARIRLCSVVLGTRGNGHNAQGVSAK